MGCYLLSLFLEQPLSKPTALSTLTQFRVRRVLTALKDDVAVEVAGLAIGGEGFDHRGMLRERGDDPVYLFV